MSHIYLNEKEMMYDLILKLSKDDYAFEHLPEGLSIRLRPLVDVDDKLALEIECVNPIHGDDVLEIYPWYLEISTNGISDRVKVWDSDNEEIRELTIDELMNLYRHKVRET